MSRSKSNTTMDSARSRSTRKIVSWRAEARDLMLFTGVTGAAVGKRIGVAQPVIQRYFTISSNPNDRRNPSAERAFAVNQAIAKLSGIPFIYPHLNSLFLAEKYPGDAELQLALREALSVYDQYFIDAWKDSLVQILSASPVKERRSFLSLVTAANRRSIIQQTTGTTSRPFETFKEITARFEIDLLPLLRSAEELSRIGMAGKFFGSLRRALYELCPGDAIKRNLTDRKIAQAHLEVALWYSDLIEKCDKQLDQISAREDVLLRHWETLVEQMPENERVAVANALHTELNAL